MLLWSVSSTRRRRRLAIAVSVLAPLTACGLAFPIQERTEPREEPDSADTALADAPPEDAAPDSRKGASVFLAVVGGVGADGGVTTAVHVAEVFENGNLGGWNPAPSLPTGMKWGA